MEETLKPNAKRLAKNTLLLYVRMFFTMAVSLYTSRVVLQALGEVNYGIYNVVGGVVGMFAIISSSLSVAVSRYLNVEMGKSKSENLPRIFSTAVICHWLLAIIVIVLAEMLGPWFISEKMNIPLERHFSALIVFQFSIMTFVVNLVSIPYNACIVAHENMKVFAYIGVLEVTLKLIIVYLLVLSSYDKLAFYAFLMFLVSLVIRVVYQLYCRRQYLESRFKFVFDKSLIREMFGFAGWNVIGSTSVVLSEQGVNILLNIFGGPIVNAARGIAMQVNTAVSSFSNNFMVALNPQITKSYASGDLASYKKMMVNGSRFSVGLLILLTLPLFLETPYILNIWLGQYPAHTISFVRLILLFIISESMSSTFTTGLMATGKIRTLQLLVGGCRMLNFPISWLTLMMWNIPELTMCIAIFLSQINLFIRLNLLKRYISISIKSFYFEVVFKEFLCFIIPLVIGHCIQQYLPETFFRLSITILLSIVIALTCMIYILCSLEERRMLLEKLRSKMGYFRNRK